MPGIFLKGVFIQALNQSHTPTLAQLYALICILSLAQLLLQAGADVQSRVRFGQTESHAREQLAGAVAFGARRQTASSASGACGRTAR